MRVWGETRILPQGEEPPLSAAAPVTGKNGVCRKEGSDEIQTMHRHT